MYVSLNNLNEGKAENYSEARKREFYEGENPKLTSEFLGTEGWNSARQLCHVNSNWEKLRK